MYVIYWAYWFQSCMAKQDRFSEPKWTYFNFKRSDFIFHGLKIRNTTVLRQ